MAGAVGSYHPGTVSPNFQADSAATACVRSLAVVLREGMACTERELRDHAAKTLADFKVPRKIVFLAEIPKGATGKLMRIGLAEKLGVTA